MKNRDNIVKKNKEYYWRNPQKMRLEASQRSKRDKERKKIKAKEHRENNKEKIKIKAKLYYDKNKGKIKEKNDSNSEIRRVNAKNWHTKNKEKSTAYRKSYYQLNKERLNIESKKYREKHKEYFSSKAKEYRKNNPDKFKEYNEKYKPTRKAKYDSEPEKNKERRKKNKQRIKNDENLRIRYNFSKRIRELIRKNKGKKHSNTIDLLGCSIPFLKKYLESLFEDGMTWANYGYDTWHIDHIIPCAAFDLTKEDDQRKCFHYTNLQPLWKLDNLKKNAKLNYKPLKTKTMAEEAVKKEVSVDVEAKKKQILQLTSKKHVKVWLLHEECLLKNKEIVEAMGTGNVGGVGNVLKDYNDHPDKIQLARAFLGVKK